MGRTDTAVLAELRKRLAKPGQRPVSPQAVRQRRKRLQGKVPMPTDIATYVLAQRAGVPLHRHLDPETLAQVASADQLLTAKEGSTSGERAAGPRGAAKPAEPREMHLGKTAVPGGALSPARVREAEQMAAVYPVLYTFENSVREFIDGHLAAAYGKDWWTDVKIVARGVRENVERAKAAEGKHRYHTGRNARFIYYTNVGDLSAITRSENGWKVFKSLFPSDAWFPALVEKIEVSRNVVAHMNPLKKRDVDRIKHGFEDWLEQIKGHEPKEVT